MKADDLYNPTGLYGQQTTQGRTVLEELVIGNVRALISCHTPSQVDDSIVIIERQLVAAAISLAKETIKQLNNENAKSIQEETEA